MSTNDTRTAKERAEDKAEAIYSCPAGLDAADKRETWYWDEKRNGFVAGFLARDAEPTTVSAEQIEKAARVIYSKTAPPTNTWEGQSESNRELYRIFARQTFRAAGFRIEGDEA